HQAVEHLRLSEGALVAAVGTGDLGEARRLPAVLVGERLLQMVGPEPLVAGPALGQWVHQLVDVAGRDPDLAGQDDGRVEAADGVALLDHGLPPLTAPVVLQPHAERAVVPGRPRAAVDLTGRVHEAAALGEADEGVDAVGGHAGVLLRTSGPNLPEELTFATGWLSATGPGRTAEPRGQTGRSAGLPPSRPTGRTSVRLPPAGQHPH